MDSPQRTARRRVYLVRHADVSCFCGGVARRAFLRAVNLVAYNPTGRGEHQTVMESVWAEFEAGCALGAAPGPAPGAAAS